MHTLFRLKVSPLSGNSENRVFRPVLKMSMVQDTDLNEEFNRDTHLIMDLPMRNRHSMKQVIEYCLVAILSHSTVQTQCTSSSYVFTNSVTANVQVFHTILFVLY